MRTRIQLVEGLASMEDIDQVILVLKDLEVEGESNYFTKILLGDLYRSEQKFSQALTQYSSALLSLADFPPESSWVTYFFRGICHQELATGKMLGVIFDCLKHFSRAARGSKLPWV